MWYVDRTSDFRAKVKDLARSYPPPSKRRRKQDPPGLDVTANDGFLVEAYAILGHITTLSNLLASIRRPYLNVDSQSTTSRPAASRSLDFASSSAWGTVRSLTNDERDQIDLQARVILSQCADRVTKLEQLEKVRSNNVSSKANPLLKYLPSLLPPTEATVYSELIAAHRSNVAWYLTRRLADVSASQKDMQEERVKRQLDRARTLGGSTTASYGAGPSSSTASFGSSSFQFVPPPVTSASAVLDFDDDSDSEADFELSESQIQQFEEENAAILRQQEDLLASVKQAESRLLDISALQTELVVQLARQTEMVDTLYDEAIASQGEVEKGNQQLKRARERARSSRKWILMFILFATFCLLFLHWYD